MADKQFIQSFYDTVGRDLEKYLSFFSDDAEFRVMGSGETYRGKDQIRSMAEKWTKAFPDGRFEVQKVVGSGDDLSVEVSFVGTHQGTLNSPMGDIPASGKKVDVPACDTIQMKNGKIRSLNCYMAGMLMMNQIGAMPQQKAA